jgi:hypothetical protein
MLHCISVVAEKPADTTAPEADQMVDDLLKQYNPELQDQQTTVQERGGQDITTHFYGRYRFSKDNDKQTIVQELSNALDNHDDVSWYAVYCHDCDHENTLSDRSSSPNEPIKRSDWCVY